MSKAKEKNILSNVEILDALKLCSPTFGTYLREIRRGKGKSIRELAKAVKITPTYLSDLEKSNNKPPDKELLEKIMKELGVMGSTELAHTLFDLAAEGRNDIPADVKEYLKGNEALTRIIRAIKEAPNANQILLQITEKI
ncbi:MAG: helix-turn-helix transcriptional regulator [Oscillospiraceae bacterium]